MHISLGMRDLPEIERLLADLRQLRIDIEAGGIMPSEIAERLQKILDEFETWCGE